MTELLTRHREQLDNLAHALLEHETLDGPAAYRAAGQEPPRTGIGAETLASTTGLPDGGPQR